MRSTAGIPARRNGVWSSKMLVCVLSGKIAWTPTRLAAARTSSHSEAVELPSRGSRTPLLPM